MDEPVSKIEKARIHFREERFKEALAIVVTFPVLSEEDREIFTRGYECFIRPEFYKQLKRDPEACKDAATTLFKSRYMKLPKIKHKTEDLYLPNPKDISQVAVPGGYKTRIIVCAAHLYDKGFILPGPRHFDKTISTMIKILGEAGVEFLSEEQGFLDQFGLFLTRKEAAYVVTKTSQVLRSPVENGTLYSENLY